MSLDLKPTEASILPNLINSLCLRVAQVPRSRDVAIFVLTITTTTQLITLLPYASARSNDMKSMLMWHRLTLLRKEGRKYNFCHPRIPYVNDPLCAYQVSRCKITRRTR